MAKIVFNKNIPSIETALQWSAGATRREIMVINKTGMDFDINTPYDLSLGYLDKGNHSFLFINPSKKRNPEEHYGVFIGVGYEFEVMENEDGDNKAVWFSKSSSALTEGIIGIFKPDAIVRRWSYKRRSGSNYFHFDGKRWNEIAEYEVNPILGKGCEIKEIE